MRGVLVFIVVPLTVGAICCTRTDAELRELLKPSLADRITACSEPFTVWAKRAWRTGARFDTVEWARKASFFTMGSMTFKEAYERTGRIFNVSGAWAKADSGSGQLGFPRRRVCLLLTGVPYAQSFPTTHTRLRSS